MKNIRTGLFAFAIGSALALYIPAASAAQRNERIIHSFGTGTDGADPEADLIDVNGILYGTTYEGGGTGCNQNHGCGTVFALDPETGAEHVAYSFCSQQNCTDGQYPFADLIAVKGTLYGTTNFGGAYGYGTVFGLDPKTGVERVLHSFGSGADGFTPFASLINVKGMLYGTTEGGGTAGDGTVYAIDPNTGAETVLYSFCNQQNCTDGTEPLGGLIDMKGTLFGTTSAGGTSNAGTVFALDLNTGAERVIHSFCSQRHCADGRFPYARLNYANGMLYGTTFWGGTKSYCRYSRGCGTAFALDPNSGVETALYSFCSRPNCSDGFEPVASLIDVRGTLYGTTLYGGDKACDQEYRQLRCGTAFALDPNTGTEMVLYSFCRRQKCADGEIPWAGLIDVNGTLYGTTLFGGANGVGTVFALKKP